MGSKNQVVVVRLVVTGHVSIGLSFVGGGGVQCGGFSWIGPFRFFVGLDGVWKVVGRYLGNKGK